MGAENGGWFCATHVLLRKRVPLPQVLVQSLQGLQRDHFASEIFQKKATLILQCINLSVLNIIELRLKKCHFLSNIKPFSSFEGHPTFKQLQNISTLIGIAGLLKKVPFYHVTRWCCKYPKVTMLGLVEFNAGANT